jgi:hypothetical protein
MNEKLKEYLTIAIFFIVLWGIFGLLSGDGFFGGIGKQIDAIGDIVSFIIKAAIFIGVIWFIISLFGKDKK